MPRKIPIVFHNGSNYDYHFIIKELAEECKKQFTCLGENTIKYITLIVPVEKEVTRIDDSGEKNTKNIFYILQFIDSVRCMVSSLSNLVNYLSEGIHRVKCKYEHNKKNLKLVQLNVKLILLCFLQYTNFNKDDLIEYKCSCCNKNYQHKLDEKLKERFFNRYKFSSNDNNKFILLL